MAEKQQDTSQDQATQSKDIESGNAAVTTEAPAEEKAQDTVDTVAESSPETAAVAEKEAEAQPGGAEAEEKAEAEPGGAEAEEKAKAQPGGAEAQEKAEAEEPEPAATAEDAADEEIPPAPVPDVEDTAIPNIIGYTGEIIGPVITLEELEQGDEEEKKTAQFYEELEKMVNVSFTTVHEQEIVHGRVVSVGEKDAVIDIGFKSDGIVSLNEFDTTLVSGDEVEVLVERLEDYHGQLVLSKIKADQLRRWQLIEDAHDKGTIVEGTIVRRIKGGMIVDLDIGGMEAFLPGSQIDVRPVRDFDTYLEKRMEFKIVKLNPANDNIVISHKALIEKELGAQRDKILATMEAGQILEGTAKNITDFGIFVDLGGVDGLLHITDLSWGRVSHPSELVELDQKLTVVVLDYDKERQRISLGLKQLQPHPWESIDEKYVESNSVEGKVVSITDYGAFVELEKGIEGLVHISEMSWTEHIRHPSQVVSLGQLVQVRILKIDKQGKKISLGMKQLDPDPWDGISERYPPGTVMSGKVRNITNFGVFVGIEPGIDGLVHISDLSWTKKVRHPNEMVRKGQGLDVVILNIDEGSRRISLGHKQVETNPWNQFAQAYAEGTDTEATVVRANEGGLVIELPLAVEAFVPASELRNGPHNFQDFYPAGQELQLRVIKFDPNQKEIVLSEVAKERAAERSEKVQEDRTRRETKKRESKEVSKYKKTAGSAGRTTLGDISGLADLKAQFEEAEQEVPKKKATPRKAPARKAPAAKKATTAKAPAAKKETTAKAPAAEKETTAKAPAAKKATTAKAPAAKKETTAKAPAAKEEATAKAPAAKEETPVKAPAAKEETTAKAPAAKKKTTAKAAKAPAAKKETDESAAKPAAAKAATAGKKTAAAKKKEEEAEVGVEE